MNESTEIIRFEIDGRWSAADMGKSLLHLEDLYNLRLVLQVVHEDWRDWEHFYFELMHFPPFRRSLKRRMLHPALFAGLYPTFPTIPLEPKDLSRISNLLYPQEQLEIRRIEYGSPGFKDLAGLGEIVGHVKDFILAIIEHGSSRRKRDLENEERELKNQQLRLENARKFVQLAKECGYTESEMRGLISWVDDRQETFIYLIDNGKIRSIKILSEQKESEE